MLTVPGTKTNPLSRNGFQSVPGTNQEPSKGTDCTSVPVIINYR